MLKIQLMLLVKKLTLDSIGITCNKNTIPFDQEKAFVTSGIRLGTPARLREALMRKRLKK